MNVIMPEKEKYTLREKMTYAIAIIVCLLTIIGVVYVEISADTSLVDMLDTSQAEQTTLGNKTEEEIEALKTIVNSKFNNNIEKNSVSSNINKIDNTKDVVCTALNVKESKQGNYEVNVVLPIININSEIIKKYNKEIENVFKSKLESVLETENKNIVYSTEYVASVNNDILSLMIRSNLKEGTSAQRTIIQTYNYDIKRDKELTLEEVLKNNSLDENKISQTIKNEIEKSQQKVEDFKELGYSIYNRNPSDKRYDIKNSKQFYCTSNTIYILYAYGNEDYTSEVDIVVI